MSDKFNLTVGVTIAVISLFGCLFTFGKDFIRKWAKQIEDFNWRKTLSQDFLMLLIKLFVIFLIIFLIAFIADLAVVSKINPSTIHHTVDRSVARQIRGLVEKSKLNNHYHKDGQMIQGVIPEHKRKAYDKNTR